MTRAYRSTSLHLMASHCPAAGSHFEHGSDQDSEVFEPGKAAHACLQAVAQAQEAAGAVLYGAAVEAAVRAAVVQLVEVGSSFDGKPEPPMRSEVAWQGAEIALGYLRLAGSLPLGLRTEVGIAVDADWNLVEYGSPHARLKAIIDALGDAGRSAEEILFDQNPGRYLLVRDYKTVWRTGPADLQTVQRKAQALLAWRALGEHYDGIRLEVVNLRTGASFSEEYNPDSPEGRAEFSRWKLDLEEEMRMRDRQIRANGKRNATPGAGCKGCPYLRICEPARALIAAGGIEDPEQAAVHYAVLEAERLRLGKLLRDATKMAEINVPQGFVGYQQQVVTRARKNIARELVDDWIGKRSASTADEMRELLVGLVAAMKPTATNLENAALVRYIDDAEGLREFMDSVTRQQGQARFGVWSDNEDEEGEENGEEV